MSSEQEQKPSGPNFVSPGVPDLKPIRYAGARTLGLGILPPVQYGLFSEKIRQNGSKQFHCSIFCEGKKCRYEDPSSWAPEEMAVKGIYSCWVTDDIVTMARPSVKVIEKYKIISQFKELGIRSLINLQERGEHGSCGVPLQKSGFSYDPQVFMENNIFYYNFDWKDYGNVSKTRLLDIVKVLAFATSEGRVAIHSHSGLGRTGVLIACYFIYTLRCKPNDAILYLRSKRPQLVQTKGQVRSIQGFAQFVVPMFIVYAAVIKSQRDFGSNLNQFLKRQRFIIHGVEARMLKHVPKPVYMCCEKLLALSDESRLLELTKSNGRIDLFAGDPNRFFGFYSAIKYQLDLQFPPSKFKAQWSLVLKDKQLLSSSRDRLVNGRLDPDKKFCAPPSPAGRVLAKFDERPSVGCPDSPESSSSGDESNLRSSSDRLLGGGLYRQLEEEDFLDYHLSEDEENGLNPELEYCNNVNIDLPNAVPASPPKKLTGKKSSPYIIANGNATILQNGGIGMNNNKNIVYLGNQNFKTVAELPKVDINENIKNHDETLPEELVIEYPFEGPAEVEEDEDLLEDMNSEECNAIIDSVLQESASEEEIPSIEHKRTKKKKDVDAMKETKGCSTTTAIEEELEEVCEREQEEEEKEEREQDEEEEADNDEEENDVLKKTLNKVVANALLADHYAIGVEFDEMLTKYQKSINNRTSAWDKVAEEKDPVMLAALLWSWLDQLKEPVLNVRDLACIVIRSNKPLEILHRLDFSTRYTTEYLVRFVVRLKLKSTLRDNVLWRMIASLTHQAVGIGGTLRPVGKEWHKMRQGTAREVMLFVKTLYDMVVAANKREEMEEEEEEVGECRWSAEPPG